MMVIASVIESLLPELADEAIPFGFTGKIRPPVAGEDQIKEFQMIRHLPGDLHVAGGRQNDGAPFRALRPEIIQ